VTNLCNFFESYAFNGLGNLVEVMIKLLGVAWSRSCSL